MNSGSKSGHQQTPKIDDIPPCPGGMKTDLGRWPIVMLTPPNHPMTDAQFGEYLDWMERYITTRGEVYAVLLDTRANPPPTPTQRKMTGERMVRLRDHTRRNCAGYAMCFESMVMRGVMTAMFWIMQPDYPTRVFASPSEALPWLNEMVAKKLRAVA